MRALYRTRHNQVAAVHALLEALASRGDRFHCASPHECAPLRSAVCTRVHDQRDQVRTTGHTESSILVTAIRIIDYLIEITAPSGCGYVLLNVFNHAAPACARQTRRDLTIFSCSKLTHGKSLAVALGRRR